MPPSPPPLNETMLMQRSGIGSGNETTWSMCVKIFGPPLECIFQGSVEIIYPECASEIIGLKYCICMYVHCKP